MTCQVTNWTLGNVGFIFTNEDLKEIRTTVLSNRIAAPARAGAFAPLDVFIPAGNTGMPPDKTSFFQALGVPTKISRGTIEITSELKLIETGLKVGASEATLLNMLNISPFTYGMNVTQIYDDGQLFSSGVLDVGEEELLGSLQTAIRNISSVSLATNFPTLPSVMHSVVNGYKKALAIAIETEYSWSEIEELKDRIDNPEAYAAAAPAAAPAAEKKEEAKEESEEESEDEGTEPSRLHCLKIFIKENIANLYNRLWRFVRLKTESTHISVLGRSVVPKEYLALCYSCNECVFGGTITNCAQYN